MQVDEVPQSEVLVTSANANVIAQAIRQALTNPDAQLFHDTEAIHGADRSGRILRIKARAGVQPLFRPMTAERAASELIRLGKTEARYGTRPRQIVQRGWEISKAVIDGEIVIIAWATWIPA